MKAIIKHLSFTKNEIRVLLLIVSVLVVGFSIKYYKEVLTKPDTEYDYSESDRNFLEKSRNMLIGSLTGDDSTLADEERKLVDSLQALEDSLDTDDYSTDKKNTSKGELKEKSININTATKEELIAIPGIGDKISDKIIIYREEHGGFKRIEDIMNVKGIKKKKFEKMKAYITVD